MVRNRILFIATVCAAGLAWQGPPDSINAHADVLSIPDPDNSQSGIPRPRRGMTMNQVLTEFGPPLKKTGPVGKPPITRWFYQDFIVNFEHEYVIHAGVKRR